MAEYAIAIAAVVTALAAVQTYVRRALQARFYNAVSSQHFLAVPQYEPYYLTAPGGNTITTGKQAVSVRSAGHYTVTPTQVTGSATTETALSPLAPGQTNGDNAFQKEWPAL